MSANKAYQTQVALGAFIVDGLMDEQGNFYVGVTDLESLGLLTNRQNHASRDLTRLLGNHYKIAHLNVIGKVGKPETSITLDEFNRVLFELSLKGNESAIRLSRALQGLALKQLFSDAFGIKMEAEERQLYMVQRTTHLQGYHPNFTRWLKRDDSQRDDYGYQMNRLKDRLCLPRKHIDLYNKEELNTLNKAEYGYDLLRSSGFSHEEALMQVHN